MDMNPNAGTPEQPITPTVVHQTVRNRPRRRRSPLRLLLLLLFVGGPLVLLGVVLIVGVGSFGSSGTIQEEHFSHERYSDNKIVILSVSGMIMDGDSFAKKQIDQAREDDDVKAIVLRVNSPGGTVTGSDYIYHYLNELREEGKPIVVSMGAMAASGGYYIAMAVGDEPNTIYAEPTTTTGSIGVILWMLNFAELAKKYGVEENTITSHRLKGMGSPTKPMTDEERAIFQELVDESFHRFKEIVKAGRPLFRDDEDALDKVATGQAFTAGQALELGLIDKIDFIEGAVDRAIQVAGLDPTDVTVVRYKREPTLSSILLGVQSKQTPIGMKAVENMATPRTYYMSPGTIPLTLSAE